MRKDMIETLYAVGSAVLTVGVCFLIGLATYILVM